MSVTSPALQPAREKSGRQILGLQIKGLAQRYAIHLGLLAIALVVLLVGRLGWGWDGMQLGLPSTAPQVMVATPDQSAGVEALSPTPAPTIAPEVVIQRGAIPHTYEPDLPTHNFTQHVVEEGDTPNKVAELYGLEPATLLWGNPDLSSKAQLLSIGITLTVLPTNGVLHTVSPSDTLDVLTEMYGVDSQTIIEYADNHLEKWPHRPVPDTQIFIPGGERQLLVWSYTANTRSGRASASSYYDGPIIAAGRGSFIWPTASWRITQYYWWAHRAIDIGAVTETPVYASDGGTVTFTGWGGLYGNLIVIDHGNGFITYYAHLNSIWVASGQFVVQGTPIGGVGTTGNSSGPHLPFEIRYGSNLLNPFDYLWE